MNKHAYLIMCHNEPYILEKLIKQIDSEHNDIYLHVDKKYKDFDTAYFKRIPKKSNIYFIDRMNVKWSSFSQIKCELELLKCSTKNSYSYYHLLSGVDLLIKNNEEIYKFIEKNSGYEFVAFKSLDSITESELNRISYYHFLNGNRRNKNILVKKLSLIFYNFILNIQKKIKINRLKKCNYDIRKGANWFSITDNLAKYILTKEKEIYKYFKHSDCADELFLQTVVINSEFKDKIFQKYNDEHLNALRFIDWNRGEPYTFKIDDFKELVNSPAFFARKFSTKIDKEIIDAVYNFTINK